MSTPPEVQIAWSDMHLWEEQSDGTWRDLGRNIWQVEGTEPRLMDLPDPRQINGALHSNGAMLARSNFQYFLLPESINFAAIEPFRERTFVHPLLFVPQWLANLPSRARTLDRACCKLDACGCGPDGNVSLRDETVT